MAGICHLGFLKTRICNYTYGSEDQCASLCKILCWSVKPLPRYGEFSVFQNGVHQPSWICYVHAWTTDDEYLAVFISVQNLVGIDTVVSIICKCWYLISLASKCLLVSHMQFFLRFYPLNGEQSHRNPQKAPSSMSHDIHIVKISPTISVQLTLSLNPQNPMLCYGLDTPL